MTPPLFIVLEGIDGSGTTTQLDRLAGHLSARGRRVHATREPSAGPVGRLLREILLGGHRLPDGSPADGRAMALLFAADRRDHLRREIEPALAAGIDVVCDRYLLSSLAYQGEEAERGWVAELARDVRPPDLTLLLDLPVSVAPPAAARNATTPTRFRSASPPPIASSSPEIRRPSPSTRAPRSTRSRRSSPRLWIAAFKRPWASGLRPYSAAGRCFLPKLDVRCLRPVG
jgi:dTMP kinase